MKLSFIHVLCFATISLGINSANAGEILCGNIGYGYNLSIDGSLKDLSLDADDTVVLAPRNKPAQVKLLKAAIFDSIKDQDANGELTYISTKFELTIFGRDGETFKQTVYALCSEVNAL
jgi:hypothetical protein